tara:strand:+ start:63963 stop:66098 length:2136 start_codon:yes stop_codon:yes gene_type:complete
MNKNVFFLIGMLFFPFISVCVIAQTNDQSFIMKGVQPHYKRTNYSDQSILLNNEYIQVQLFRRIGGWGWGEISTPSGKLMAVLDHLGEIMLRDQDIPMRFEAEKVTREGDERGESLVFSVKSVVARNNLKGTSFEEWMSYPFAEPAITGEVTLTLAKDQPLIYLQYRLKASGNYFARYIRGPWLKVGEASFDTEKDDSMFPGVDWPVGDEWSSGTDWFKDPWALRSVPHPYKVTAPLMALSHDGTGIGLAWNPNQVATRWFNYRVHRPQPVFATPNFIDRMNNNLMGLMIPDASIEGFENEVVASQPLELKIGQMIHFDAEIWLSEGSSMDVMLDWVKRHGLPEPSDPKWSYTETIDRIANAYNTNLWHEGEGFGIRQRPENKIRPNVPSWLDRYIKENKGTKLSKELQKKVDWCRSQKASVSSGSKRTDVNNLVKKGDELIRIQRNDGSFYFDPDGRHYRKDDFKIATSFIEPMGHAFDDALDIVVVPALDLLDIARETGIQKYADAAKKALEYSMKMDRPEGGDFWETPLHAPNLLAAGHAAIAYYEAYKTFGDQRYQERAIYWIRTILPFTHLWEPDDIEMIYNTKPVLSSSDWYFANWVRDHVQWEVLAVFSSSANRRIRWDKIDTQIDWKRFHEGITNAAIRWINVHTDNNWRPHNIPSTYESYLKGDFDYCYPDTHNSTTGNYGGMFIMPDPIVLNIYSVIDNKN